MTDDISTASGDAGAAPVTTTTDANGVDFQTYLGVLPEADRELYTKNGVDSFEKQSKWVSGLNSLIGKKGLMKPADDAPDADKQAYNKALYKEIGVPEDGKYEYQLPEVFTDKYKEHVSPEILSEANKIAHEEGMTPKALQRFNDLYLNAYAGMIDESAEASKPDWTGLQKEWGKGFDSKVKLASTIYTTGLSPEDPTTARFNQKFGNDPDAVKIFANVAHKFGVTEDSLDTGKANQGTSSQTIRENARAKLTESEELFKMGKYGEADIARREANELYSQHTAATAQG